MCLMKCLWINLHLIDENGYLIRAAMLAFYNDPEKWVTGAYVKIGFFGKSDSDLKSSGEVHGPLLEQVDKTIEFSVHEIYEMHVLLMKVFRG